MALALHWAHKESSPAVAGAGGGRLVCSVPPQITLRWPLSMADRYNKGPGFTHMPTYNIELLDSDFGFNIAANQLLNHDLVKEKAIKQVLEKVLISYFKVQNKRT